MKIENNAFMRRKPEIAALKSSSIDLVARLAISERFNAIKINPVIIAYTKTQNRNVKYTIPYSLASLSKKTQDDVRMNCCLIKHV